MLEKLFKLNAKNTSVKTEIIAGITTFLAMAYILGVNPGHLRRCGNGSTGCLYGNCDFCGNRFDCDGTFGKLSGCACTWYGRKCFILLYGCYEKWDFLGKRLWQLYLFPV